MLALPRSRSINLTPRRPSVISRRRTSTKMVSFVVGLRRFLGALALLLLAHGGAAAEQPTFVGRSGTKLVVNGSTFLFNGFNAYWLMNVAAQDQAKVTKTLSDAAAAGLTVCRTWAFSDGGNAALQSSPGVYNEQVFQVRPASASFPYRNAVDLKSIRPRLFRRSTSSSRRPKITVSQAWVMEMAAHTKSIDSKHLLQVGFEGFYGSTTPDKIKLYNPGGYKYGTDFITSNQVNEIDFTTIHVYQDSWLPKKSDKERQTFLQQWISLHLNDSVNVLGKPMVFTEFGKSKKTPGYSQKVRDDFLSYVYGLIYSDAKTGGGSHSGGLLWQIMGDGMESYYDGYEVVLSTDTTTTAVIKKQSEAMAALANKPAASHD
ncbi:hypothetical protein GW17_00027645 [Ensete ventricosum]|nr:hypothetical protein GW17_00027645 [Ensete ventricosum]